MESIDEPWVLERSFFVIPLHFDDFTPFHEGLAGVRGDERWGHIDKRGRMVIEPEFDAAWEFHERMPVVMEKGKWGFIDMMGGMVIKPQFDNVLSFRGGLAPVKMNTKWGATSTRRERWSSARDYAIDAVGPEIEVSDSARPTLNK